MSVVDHGRPDLGGNIRHGDSHTFSPHLWRYLIERFAVHSVLDVGCGEGHAVDWFNRNGVYAVGIDGLELNVRRSVHPIARHDLTTGVFDFPCDMVWSCEVAEHIEERYVDNYVRTLANGHVVAMTHAVPGQGGHHHVNEQPTEYWVEAMRRYGYELHPDVTYGRAVEPAWTYFGQTGLLFTR